jgi:hypothetical protein
MKSHELFQQMSPAQAAEIFGFLHEEEKPVYKAAIQGLANQRNLRPVFVERKPRDERNAWMKASLGRPRSDALATHLVQAWLLGAHKPMLREFLTALEIPHEEDGTVEDLPACPPKEKLQAAVDQLLQKWSLCICMLSATWTARCNGQRSARFLTKTRACSSWLRLSC